MTRTRRRTLEILLQILCIVLLLALLVGVLFSEVARRAEYWHGERAMLATVTDCYAATAYFFRDEVAVESVDNGPVFYLAANGAAVTAGQALATVYADGANAGTRERARVLSDELARLEAALADTLPDFYGAYGSLMGTLSGGSLPAGDGAANTILDALDKRDAAANGDAYRARIEALRAELADLIKNDAAAFADATASLEGIFYREADGYESVMTPAALATLTPGGLRALLASPQSTERAVGRVVREGPCYFALTMPAASCDLRVGDAYDVTLVREALSLTATLERVSDADGDGTVLLTFSLQAPPEALRGLRYAEITIARGAVTGISLPMSAVFEEEGALVTYVAREGVAKRLTLSPLYKKDGCLLVAQGTGEDALLVGDVVVISARRVYDGKVLK